MVRKEDLPNNSVFGKALFEIWALKVLLKRPKLARPPHKKPATTPKIQDIDEQKLYILEGNSSRFQICTQNLVPSNF